MAEVGCEAGVLDISTTPYKIRSCTLVDDIVPLGRNRWEQVAPRYNASRTRGSPERGVESLRRKFKNLYSKKKPTSSGEVPVRLRPVAMAKAAPMKIADEGGVHTSHDGRDEGDDDTALLDDEEEGPIDISLAGAYSFSGNESSSGDDGITDVSAEDMDQRPAHPSATSTTPQQPPRVITPTSATSARPRLDRGGSHNSSMETSVPMPTARGSVAIGWGEGQDLRVFRDTFEAMTQGMLNTSANKSPAERSKPDGTSSTPSFSKNKARQRLNEIQREIEEAERRQSSAGGDIMGMLLLFQKDSDRRAETEEKRRRQERDERLEAAKRERDERREAEKRERDERKRIRSAEAKAAVERRQEDAQAARKLREEQRSAELAKEAQLELDREENKRCFEE
ncbi:unnamed protein product [Phytophthora fragariaefolia]|uniref:Unnamed protein product n=1 Tax=Phytophthora fragariaefolia TaxID=1490495 RepID=A0A9W6XFE0_9STRA|nr:unnamed protein product [Phytophthora fragariaefolia]